jgi:hypothetical protein
VAHNVLRDILASCVDRSSNRLEHDGEDEHLRSTKDLKLSAVHSPGTDERTSPNLAIIGYAAMRVIFPTTRAADMAECCLNEEVAYGVYT